MKSDTQDLSCAIGCALVAAFGGLVVFAMLLMLANFSVLQAVIFAGLAFLAGWAFLSYAFCRPLPALGELGVPGSAHRPASSVPPFAHAQPRSGGVVAAAAAPAGMAAVIGRVEDAVDPALAAPVAVDHPGVEMPVAASVMAAPVMAEPEMTEPVLAEPVGPAAKPTMLAEPRGGVADDLKVIRGIGPKLEQVLHGMGVFHFSQIADWHAAELAWMDDNLEGFKGRASRDKWVVQAKVLAHGGSEADAFAAADAAP